MKLVLTVPALMFVLSLTACGTTEEAPRGAPTAPPIAKATGPALTAAPPAVAAPPVTANGAPGVSLPGAAAAPKSGPAMATPTGPQGAAKAENPTGDKLEIRRLLLASRVIDREPELALAPRVNEPLLAFVEAKNQANAEERLVVTFEHESGTKVGFVELRVPAGTKRYRTWARTRNLKEAGNWTVVVRNGGGAELGRAAFVVTEG